METTERIVEAYVRYVKGWATISNIRCPGQYEIDLLAIDPAKLARYHIETGVSISSAFSKLTGEPFSPEALKQRVQGPQQRRTIGYFVQRKFGAQEVLHTLERYGFRDRDYAKIIVSWGWTDEATQQADAVGIELWDFRDLMTEIVQAIKSEDCYFSDDIMRTLHLFSRRTKGKRAETG